MHNVTIDVPTTYLPRFFLSLPSSPSIILTDPIESLPSAEETMVLCPDMEWRCGAKSWKGALNMVVGRRGKIEKMDVVLGNKNDEGEMFLKGALRVLKVSHIPSAVVVWGFTIGLLNLKAD